MEEREPVSAWVGRLIEKHFNIQYMAQTKILQFTCVNVTTDTFTHSLLAVSVKEPKISDILEGIHDSDIKNWTRNHKLPEELFEPEQIKKWVSDNYNPEEVFSKDELEEWARKNGFTDFS